MQWRQLSLALLLFVSQWGKASSVSETLCHSGQHLTQRGMWYNFPLHSPQSRPPARITQINWQVRFLASSVPQIDVMLCHRGICHRLAGLSGVSQQFRGIDSEGAWQLQLRLPGSGVDTLGEQLVRVCLTLNSQVNQTRGTP